MKIGNSLPGFSISARGLSIQRKRMNLIAENIANAENTRTFDGQPYKRKFMVVSSESDNMNQRGSINDGTLRLRTSNVEHISDPRLNSEQPTPNSVKMQYEVLEDRKQGEVIYMPNHPDADEKGYVQMSNVNIIEEMVEMIAASRSYEANLTALNASKEIAKDSLEI